jgi:trehalose/maltose hydrolase-like predicted phosphorylase
MLRSREGQRREPCQQARDPLVQVGEGPNLGVQAERSRLRSSAHRGTQSMLRTPKLAERGSATGWDGLLAEQRQYLDDFWDRADVEVDGDREVQQAVRFGLFPCCGPGPGRRTGRSPPRG